MNSTSDNPSQSGSFSLNRVLWVVIPLALLALIAFVVIPNRIKQSARQETDQQVISRLGLTSASPGRLNSKFDDADGDLVADTPQDASRHVTPGTIYFSYVAGPDATEEIAAWSDFVAHLSRVTGVQAAAITFSNTSEQLQALRDEKLHVTGFNTGTVPTAVTQFGFVPLCTVGREDGTFGSSMRVVVPTASPVKKLSDLKDRTVTFTLLDSNSGCKAAITLLREYGLLPQRDYKWRFSGSHQESIKGVATGSYEAAPVSDDLFQRALADGEVSADRFRTIYESERFPPATVGYVYNLSPELSQKIRQAFMEYTWKDSALEKLLGATAAIKFVPVSYKQDFALVRRIDDSFRKSPTEAGE